MATLYDRGGYAEYTFNIQQSGDYVVWGKIYHPDGNSDSFFVSVDRGYESTWDFPRASRDNWEWDEVSDRYGYDPIIYTLAPGLHTLKIRFREEGARIDKILITNDMNFVPTGIGE